MRVIQPVTITDAMLVSHNVSEPAAGETAWNAATAYAVGDLAMRSGTNLHSIYRRLVAGTTATAPESDTINWKYVSGTNRWAVFDQITNSQTTRTSPLDITIKPGIVNGVALVGLVGDTVTVTMTDGLAGPTVYSAEVDLSLSVVADWYAYYYEPFRQRGSVVLVDLPPYEDGHIRIEIEGSGTVKCGGILVGGLYEFGSIESGAQAGIVSYSRKTTDETTGLVSVESRRSVKTLKVRLMLDTGAVTAAHTVLQDLLDVVCVWLGDNGEDIEPLQVVGFYKDFKLLVQYDNLSYYTLEIEGTA